MEKNIANKYLRGFTLSEVLVAMMLTSLVMLVAMSAIFYFQQLFLRIQKTSNLQSQINLLQVALDHDFSNCKKAQYDDHLVLMNDQTEIEYEFTQQSIIRKCDESIDTFEIKCQPPVVEVSAIDESLINLFSVNCYIVDSLTVPVSVYKKYSTGIQIK